jgi:hypothetical protein
MKALRDILGETVARTPDPALAAPLAWMLAAGPELAPRAHCQGLAGGALRLRPVDGAARAQIASVEKELVAALRRTLGPECVRVEFLPCP